MLSILRLGEFLRDVPVSTFCFSAGQFGASQFGQSIVKGQIACFRPSSTLETYQPQGQYDHKQAVEEIYDLTIRCRAGAHWLPHARAHEPEICDWDVQTYEYWLELMRREEEELEAKGRLELPYSGLKVSLFLDGLGEGER